MPPRKNTKNTIDTKDTKAIKDNSKSKVKPPIAPRKNKKKPTNEIVNILDISEPTSVDKNTKLPTTIDVNTTDVTTIDVNTIDVNITDVTTINVNATNDGLALELAHEKSKPSFPLNIIDNNGVKLKQLYHISDLHIHLFKRHDEYNLVFKRLLSYLQQERFALGNTWSSAGNRGLPCAIVLTGDILHCKSDLSPECVAMTYKLFKDLASIMPLIIIPGNHDMNINNKTRMDSLTPIIGDLPKYYPVHYLDKTGLWYMGGCVFSHASIFDYYIIDPTIISEELARCKLPPLSLIDEPICNTLITNDNDNNSIKTKPKSKSKSKSKSKPKDKIDNAHDGDDNAMDDSDTTVLIGLYHGRINGVELYNGTKIEGEKTGTGSVKRTITIGNFNGYHMGLFGDIHKRQFLDNSCSRGYAGSLIQQNYGEDLDDHGLIKWSIDNRHGEFVNIVNDWGFYTFHLKSGKCNDITREVEGGKININKVLPRNLCARILYDMNTSQVQLQMFSSMLREIFTVVDSSAQSEESASTAGNNDYAIGDGDGDGDGNGSNDNGGDGINSINIRDVECQNRIIRDIITNDFEGVPPEDIDTIMELNRESNKLLVTRASTERGLGDSISDDESTGRKFKLVRLEFDNFFCYGEGNYVDFRECKGVVGIVASNHMGKSAIIDILLYALYDKFPRKGTAKDIINIRKNKYRVRLEICMGSYYYIIEKSGQRTKTGIGKTQCLFSRKNMQTGKITNLGEMTATKLKGQISEIFGNYEDMINTNFSIQTNSTGFIDAENTARRKELERILRFDFINDLVKEANDNYRHNKSIFEHLQKNLPPEVVKELATNIEQKNTDVIELDKTRSDLSRQVTESQTTIDNINTQINPELDSKMIDMLADIDMTPEDMGHDIDTALAQRKHTLEHQKSTLSESLQDIGTHIQSDMLELYSKLSLANVLPNNNTHNKQSPSPSHNEGIPDIPDIPDISNISDKLNKVNIGKMTDDDKTFIKQFINTWVTAIKEHSGKQKAQLDILNTDLTKQRQSNLINYKVITNTDIQKWLASLTTSPTAKQYILDKLSTMINDAEQRKITLATKLDGYNKIESTIESLEAKISKHREKITAKRLDIDNLIGEDIPDILRREVMENGTVNQSQLNMEQMDSSIVANGYKFKGKQNELNEYKTVIMQRGWLAEIEKRISSVKSSRKKIDSNRCKIKEYETRLEEWGKELSNKRIELKDGARYTKELDATEIQLNGLRADVQAWQNNYKVGEELKEMEASRDRLQEEYLNTSFMEIINDTRNRLTQYVEVELQKKHVKQQQKTLSGIKKQLSQLMAEIETNTKLHEQLHVELNNKYKLDHDLASAVKKLELGREQLAGMRAKLDKMREDCRDKIVKERMMNIYTLYRDCLKMIPLLLIARVQPLLERKVNDLLTSVTNFTVCFQITDSRIDIYLNRTIYDNDADGRMILINNSSGFERFISSLAIRIALMEISQLPSPNMMAIDEGWSCFDNENIGNLQVILDHLSQKFDFILTISHLQVIRQHCDMQIGLVKDQRGYSNVHYG